MCAQSTKIKKKTHVSTITCHFKLASQLDQIFHLPALELFMAADADFGLGFVAWLWGVVSVAVVESWTLLVESARTLRPR